MSDENKYIGTVCWFSPKKGMGFILWENEQGEPQKDLFVHFSDIVSEGFKTLNKNQKVSFNIGKNLRDQPKAINVIALKH